jgi:hypothetical protein
VASYLPILRLISISLKKNYYVILKIRTPNLETFEQLFIVSDKDIIRLARQSGATETYTRMIFETILEEQRTLDELAQEHSTGAPDAL